MEDERDNAAEWVIHPGADFVNSLCPNKSPFPRIDGLTEIEHEAAENAFKRAFNLFKEAYDALRAERFMGTPNAAELRCAYVIERKTLHFGKLIEKIPRRMFVEGAIDKDGNYLRDQNGFFIAKATQLVDSEQGRAVDRLVAKQLVGRASSAPHPYFGESSIYASRPFAESINFLLDEATQELARARPVRALEIRELFLEQLHTHCQPICVEAEAYRITATQKVLEFERKQAEKKAAKKAADSVQPVAPAGDISAKLAVIGGTHTDLPPCAYTAPPIRVRTRNQA